MPSLEAAIVARLAATNAVVAIVDGRVYANVLPQGVAYPAVRYQRISTPRLKSLSGPTGRARPRFQIDCYGERHSEVLALSEAIRGALDGFVGLVPIGSGATPPTVQIDASSAEDEEGGYEDDVRVHHQRLDFILSHEEG